MKFLKVSVLYLFNVVVSAQFPVPPSDLEVIGSSLNDGVKISYKQISLCETTEGVKSFSGYVHLPREALADLSFDYDINTFFLYFGARNDPDNAPLVIYFAGGPGESSSYSALDSEGGPCYVNFDGSGTSLNPWSFNNHANVLYIDQPVGAGFSYTSLVNATYNITSNEIVPLTEYNGRIPESNLILGQGTYTDPTIFATTNTSVSSAKAVWHFAEHWLTQFPEYKSSNKKIGFWGNSAGGFWAPATAALFDKQIKASAPESPIRLWSVDHVGITNGVIDWEHDLPYWPSFIYNNTYEPLISEDVYLSASQNFTKHDGCHDLIRQCRAFAQEGDPDARGTNETVNSLCRNATTLCWEEVGSTILGAERSVFDIAVSTSATSGADPCPYYLPVYNYLNQRSIQEALGVPVNFTYISQAVLQAYTLDLGSGPPAGTGDGFRTNKSNIEYLLQNDIKVALINGDRDSRAPWTAAEDYAINANYSGHDGFSQSGYQYITTNHTYQGGAVRQYGHFSFSRIFQSGHFVNAYQPETVYRIFERIRLNMDIATGNRDVTTDYSTHGPSSTLGMFNGSLPKAPGTCMVLGAFQEASPWTEIYALASGQSAADNGSQGHSGNTPQSTNNTSSISANVQPAGILAFGISIFVVMGVTYGG
ncbi:hypothetical protein LTR84_000411 [Exophiala bonariae]|uniref:Uncharacterized protein n=1 Tax=Exophiala bonariae TaxID=1690606 RepID=A0AAV9NUI5_9EURO|nr:hypothetical protein LTR84_000411 [Exophiala bonariae]